MPTFTINRKGGYEPIEVDTYINSLEQQLKEYENKASAINKAIISAQMASDKMIRQANEETASVIKKANDESAIILKKANDEAAEILQKANEEKNIILLEAKKCSVALAQNADKQIKDIKDTITQQRTLINNFNKEYTALVDKYLKSYKPENTADIVKNLDEMDEMLTKWEKEGIPEIVSAPRHAPAGGINPAMAAAQHRTAPFGMGMQKPAATNIPSPAPKAEPVKQETPSPLAASSVPKPSEEMPKQQEPLKPFIKTGLAGGAGMGGIPANPSYGLGGERSLKNSVSHSEPPKSAEPVPEPVSAAKINVPKFGESVQEESKPADEAPKPGIYKVTADNHLYNENRGAVNTANAPVKEVPEDNAVPQQTKPGIYKVEQDSESQQAKPGIYKVEQDNVPQQAKPGIYKVEQDNVPQQAKPGIYKVEQENAMPRPGIYKVTSDNKLYNDNTDK